MIRAQLILFLALLNPLGTVSTGISFWPWHSKEETKEVAPAASASKSLRQSSGSALLELPPLNEDAAPRQLEQSKKDPDYNRFGSSDGEDSAAESLVHHLGDFADNDNYLGAFMHGR
eukprot:TRINITY_DN5133_c0_g1_i2.p1 TRINITY_DN5133_c0_g1~~TRINITY_DN5133_c0_g1_i2.p1  ORF type:complete len:117 (-),score=20.66 TRINITY_DN5133_c0_g1_i2:206-556(-)